MIKLSIIIPTLNRDIYLKSTLESIKHQLFDFKYEIIIIDQNVNEVEKRNSILNKKIKDENITYLHLPGKGVVFGRNEAIHNAQGEIILFIDDDVKIEDKYFLQKHLNNYTEKEEISAVCGREINPSGNNYCESLNYNRDIPLLDIFHFPRNYSKRIEATIFSTCNSSIRKKVLLKLGCFDKDFKGASYGDDSDLALRLTNEGYKIIYDPETVLMHLMAGSGGLRITDSNNKFTEKEKLVSRFVFYRKHIKHMPLSIKFYYIYNYILRTSLFTRVTLNKPWKMPKIAFELIALTKKYH